MKIDHYISIISKVRKHYDLSYKNLISLAQLSLSDRELEQFENGSLDIDIFEYYKILNFLNIDIDKIYKYLQNKKTSSAKVTVKLLDELKQ